MSEQPEETKKEAEKEEKEEKKEDERIKEILDKLNKIEKINIDEIMEKILKIEDRVEKTIADIKRREFMEVMKNKGVKNVKDMVGHIDIDAIKDADELSAKLDEMRKSEETKHLFHERTHAGVVPGGVRHAQGEGKDEDEYGLPKPKDEIAKAMYESIRKKIDGGRDYRGIALKEDVRKKVLTKIKGEK